MSHEVTRREFLEQAAVLGAGVAALGRTTPGMGAPAGTQVVQATRAEATTTGQPNAAVVKEMVDAAVRRLSGKRNRADAWATFVQPDDIVAIKVNCLFGVGASTHPEVTQAVIDGCKAAGVPDDHLIVWDREDKHLRNAGYPVNRGKGVKFYGVGPDWEETTLPVHTHPARLARILTRTCTALINVPVLKSHSIAGITASLKNHYGSFAQPAKAHAGNCDPYLAELNALSPIRQKTRLIVCDALLPIADGGPQRRPQFTWAENTILAATDPVALDAVGLRIIDKRRVQIGKPPIEPSGKARGIFTAAAKGLGIADSKRIALVHV